MEVACQIGLIRDKFMDDYCIPLIVVCYKARELRMTGMSKNTGVGRGKKYKYLKQANKIKKLLDSSFDGQGCFSFFECSTDSGACQMIGVMEHYAAMKDISFLLAVCKKRDMGKPYYVISRLLEQCFQNRSRINPNIIEYIQTAPYVLVGALPFLDEWRISWGGFDMLSRDTINREIVSEKETIFKAIGKMVALIAEDEPVIISLPFG